MLGYYRVPNFVTSIGQHCCSSENEGCDVLHECGEEASLVLLRTVETAAWSVLWPQLFQLSPPDPPLSLIPFP